MGLLAIVYCVGLITNFSIYGIPNKYSLTLFKGWSICCATGGQLRAIRGVNLKRDEAVSLSVFSTYVNSASFSDDIFIAFNIGDKVVIELGVNTKYPSLYLPLSCVFNFENINSSMLRTDLILNTPENQ